MTIAIIILWIACGVLHYGMNVYHFQTEYHILAAENAVADRVFAATFALLGPIALLTTLLLCRPYGWRM